ncbi:MAG: DUF3667 domain-containing protein [Microscillaceae bacterium]|jgi:hypothetical protein|nr:DUF3667 domain-containing protein [Microscillaceae bacterium]
MPHQRRKTPECLNCGFTFQNQENYCPQCGQENDDKRKSLGSFLRDFWADLIQIDNNFFRSIIPFLFRPGRLTNEYNLGRRRNYVAPIRMYLILSFLYFFFISFEIKKTTGVANNMNRKGLAEMTIEDRQNRHKKDSIRLIELRKILQTKKYKDAQDSAKIARKVYRLDSLLRDSAYRRPEIRWSLMIFGEKDEFGYNDKTFAQVGQLSKAGLSEEKIMDTLKIPKTFFRRLMTRQIIRLGNATPEMLISSFMEKIPIMMFLLLPIFAFFLKIIYIRSKRYFIEHLVFTLHIHSFYFLFFIVLLAWVELVGNMGGEYIGWSALLPLFYTYKSFRNVYRQNRFKTVVKMSILGFMYSITFFVFLALTLLVGLLIF